MRRAWKYGPRLGLRHPLPVRRTVRLHERLQGIVMRIRPAAAARRNRVTQRPGPHLPVELIKRAHHRKVVIDRRRSEMITQIPLARPRIYATRRRAVLRRARPGVAARIHSTKSRTSARCACSHETPAVSRNRSQRSNAQRIRPDAQRAKVTRRHMPQELADRCDLNAGAAHQRIRQRRIRTPHHPAGTTNLQPSRITLLQLTITHRHEPESQHLNDTPSNRATPLVRSTNTDHGPPICLPDGPPMFPMVRRPKSHNPSESAGRRADMT